MLEKIDNKQRLLVLAKDLFLESGYKSIKTDDLAKELGISKRTIYEMFPSKDDLLIEALQLPIIEFANNMDALALKIVEDDHFTFFENLKLIWELIIDHSSLFSSKFDAEIKKYLPQFYTACKIHSNKRSENFRKVFELGVKKGYLKQDINIDVFMSVMQFTMSNILRYENLTELSMKVEDVLKQIFTIVFTGAMTPEGTAKYLESIENK
jgi:AcrR family transcriptional regulator